jgi:hypothetical protein
MLLEAIRAAADPTAWTRYCMLLAELRSDTPPAPPFSRIDIGREYPSLDEYGYERLRLRLTPRRRVTVLTSRDSYMRRIPGGQGRVTEIVEIENELIAGFLQDGREGRIDGTVLVNGTEREIKRSDFLRQPQFDDVQPGAETLVLADETRALILEITLTENPETVVRPPAKTAAVQQPTRADLRKEIDLYVASAGCIGSQDGFAEWIGQKTPFISRDEARAAYRKKYPRDAGRPRKNPRK